MTALEIALRIIDWDEAGRLVDGESFVQNNAPKVARMLLALTENGKRSFESWWSTTSEEKHFQMSVYQIAEEAFNAAYRADWNAAVEHVAMHFDEMAAVHARQSKWMGPQRQYYEGPRPKDVEASPMNGPAIAYDADKARAATVRSMMRVAAPGSTADGRTG